MTVDEFTRIFKQCPVCKSPVIYLSGSNPSFACEGYDACFSGWPDVNNITKIQQVLLYYKNHCYEYFRDAIQVFLLDDDAPSGPEPIGHIVCDDTLMVKLFSKPKNILKYFLVS